MNLNNIFSQFNDLTVLVVGDVMIDAYCWGSANRLSPEAPVPVLSVVSTEERLGGAANVALNLQALGATPIICTIVGNDKAGNRFVELLQRQAISHEGIIQTNQRPTTTKTRFIAQNQHLLRVDSEDQTPIDEPLSQKLFQAIKHIIETKKIDVVVVEDYDKGVLNPTFIHQLIELCLAHNIPTTIDPKKRNFWHYHAATLFKPNLKEMREGLNILDLKPTLNDLNHAAELFYQRMGCQQLLVTLSEHGVFYWNKNGSKGIIQAHIRQIADVSGAGDTVISVASLCLALGLESRLIAHLSNLAGGLVCEQVGVVPINKNQLEAESKHLFD